jgi:hypothetical protein
MPKIKIWLFKKPLKFNTRFIISCTYRSKKKKNQKSLVTIFVYKHLKFKCLRNISKSRKFARNFEVENS